MAPRYCHGNKPENCQYLNGCHDFCATGKARYLNTAVKCSLDTSELQNFIIKPRSADDEKSVWNLLCLRGEREGEGGRRRRRGGEKDKGREERRGGEGKMEGKGGKEVKREDSNNFFPVRAVLHVQYKCKALKVLMTEGEGGRKDANHWGLFPQKNKQNLQNSIGESRTNGYIVCGERGHHVCYISSLPPFPLSFKLHTYSI